MSQFFLCQAGASTGKGHRIKRNSENSYYSTECRVLVFAGNLFEMKSFLIVLLIGRFRILLFWFELMSGYLLVVFQNFSLFVGKF